MVYRVIAELFFVVVGKVRRIDNFKITMVDFQQQHTQDVMDKKYHMKS